MTDDHDPVDNDSGFDDVETILRQLTAEDGDLLPLPDDLWDNIAAEAGVTAPDNSEAEASEPTGATGTVIDLGQRRRFPRRLAALSAAAAALVVVGGIAVVSQRADNNGTVLASAELAYDPVRFDALGADAAAQASLVEDDGLLRVEFEASNLPNPQEELADLEVWLIEPDADGNPVDLVSLGLIDPANPGEFEVPPGYDPDVFFVVDISVEPRDGDATHSGRSILRGPLTEA